ncbi:hypothetical protein SODALDRAFT_331623 [Sodiomyces alkalinus F11]|uniref:Structure-specific endonuclease subunit SLX4 n=1 Tax=Sodiomyces alkalinus (strain CBS 110278 / VKM F-3762 / F11) TaxID=1314773 RepID=A0A3N2PYK9_SODAK|nr:hypothetical protein SODALDRAFT_331623 [Sodiomyces alkalinus F11]ROT39506.1 hypothetical protein SODALDRAFT_331623 [Sodiomyces alkalinus F11]
MATPFKPPPLPPSRHDDSSSPFPTLDEIRFGITKPSRKHEEFARSSSHHTPVPTTHAASFLTTKQTPIDLVTPARLLPTEPIDDDYEEDPVQVIRIPAPGTKKGRRKAGSGRLREVKPKRPKPPTGEETPDKKPWKKYKPSESPESEARCGKAKTGQRKDKTRKASEVRSHYFPTVKPNKSKESNESNGDQSEVPAPQIADADAPLELPPASKRRLDWTPPPADKLINLDPASSDIRELVSSTAKHPSNDASKEVFGHFLAKYGREEEQIEAAVVGSLEGIPEIFKKRKQPELAVPEGTDTSPIKKAPKKKKKPRTITELATAAYARPDESEQEPPTASILDYVQQQANAGDAGAKATKKPGRKPTRRKNGKAAPPEPVLLSPNAAIREVAKQDFVFGTSSQLAREQSPTVLRDLQTALRLSNEEACEDGDPFVIPIHSDPFEPEQRRRKLWEVGARDEDGGLLDLEVINLVDTPLAKVPLPEDDPFGYVGDAKRVMSLRRERSLSVHDESFPDVDVLLKDASAGRREEGVSGEKAVPSASSFRSSFLVPRDLSRPSATVMTTTTIATTSAGSGTKQLCTPPYSGQTAGASQTSTLAPAAAQKLDTSSSHPGPSTTQTTSAAAGPGVPPKPKYELYTDSQLSREITSYGFKPVKRRAAMLALLDQCWESKHTRARAALSPLPSNRSLSTTSQKQQQQQQHKGAGATEPTKATAPQPAAKRPRGRPRKDSTASKKAHDATKPKPGTKAGREAKAPASETTTAKTATVEPVQPATPTRPKRRTASSRCKTQKPAAEVIEIPDSASDSSAALTCSPDGSFSSPPGVEIVSLSLDEETETSLVPPVSSAAAAADQQQSGLMRHITRAIRDAPPSKDPSRPSWHEKMLMYDPVILEDLAAWLNSGQLTGVGYDGEVSAWEVKQWCESKSVCCLWRVNVSGKERKRF